MLALALVPALYLSSRWLAALPGLVVEHWGPREALRKSWQLTKGQVRRCLGYSLLLFLLNFLVLTLPFLLIQWVIVIVVPSGEVTLANTLSSAASAFAGIFWQPLYAAALVLFYYDLRVRREGYDLALRVGQLAATTPGEAGA